MYTLGINRKRASVRNESMKLMYLKNKKTADKHDFHRGRLQFGSVNLKGAVFILLFWKGSDRIPLSKILLAHAFFHHIRGKPSSVNCEKTQPDSS